MGRALNKATSLSAAQSSGAHDPMRLVWLSVRFLRPTNNAVERPAGSHSLAAAAHRERWADEEIDAN